MTLPRRQLIGLAGAAVGATIAPLRAWSQPLQRNYPTRPVRVIVTYRSRRYRRRFHPDRCSETERRAARKAVLCRERGRRRTGNIGTGQAAKAAPDGHTILFAFSSFVVNPSLFAQVPYDPLKSFEPVTLAVASTHVLTVNPSVPARTMKELVDLVRANPAQYSFASGGTGTRRIFWASSFACRAPSTSCMSPSMARGRQSPR